MQPSFNVMVMIHSEGSHLLLGTEERLLSSHVIIKHTEFESMYVLVDPVDVVLFLLPVGIPYMYSAICIEAPATDGCLVTLKN